MSLCASPPGTSAWRGNSGHQSHHHMSPSSPSVFELPRTVLYVLQTWPQGGNLAMFPSPGWACFGNISVDDAETQQLGCRGCCQLLPPCPFYLVLCYIPEPCPGAPAGTLDNSGDHPFLLSDTEHCTCTSMFHCRNLCPYQISGCFQCNQVLQLKLKLEPLDI